MIEHIDDILTVLRRQVEQHALVTETVADVSKQLGQVNVIGVNLVDDDHPAQFAGSSSLHHPFGIQFDTVLGVDDDHGGIDRRQRTNGLSGEIGESRRVNQMDVIIQPVEADDSRIDRMTKLFFLRIKIADGIALFDGSTRSDRAGRGKQCFGKGGLACGAVTDKCYGTKIGGNVLTHVFSYCCRILSLGTWFRNQHPSVEQRLLKTPA